MKRGYAKGGIYRAEMGEPPSPDEGPTVKTSRVVQKKDAVKSSPRTESRSQEQVFKADMLQKFGGKMKEPPTDPEVAYRKGGYVKAADGCAQRGKTKGKVI